MSPFVESGCADRTVLVLFSGTGYFYSILTKRYILDTLYLYTSGAHHGDLAFTVITASRENCCTAQKIRHRNFKGTSSNHGELSSSSCNEEHN